MPTRSRCEKPEVTSSTRSRSRRGDATSRGNRYTTPVCQVSHKPGSELTRLRQAEEGRVSPTADGRKRESSSPTASCRYPLRSRTRGAPVVRPATSHTTVKAPATESRVSSTRTSREGSNSAAESRKRVIGEPKNRSKSENPPLRRPKRSEVQGKILCPKHVRRFGTWNVRTLNGSGKIEQLANEMKRYRVDILGITETHLPHDEDWIVESNSGYSVIISGRQDGRHEEGVGLALTPHARSALRHYQAISSRLLTAEFMSHSGPLMVIVAYAPTNQDSTEVKDQFYHQLDCVMHTTNGSGMVVVLGDFNATIGEEVLGVTGPHALGQHTSDNGERLLSFATTHGLCITNTMFQHKRIHQASWYPPNAKAQPSLKDYILVRQRMRSFMLDTRVYRGADIDSDHRLVVTSIVLKLNRHKKKTMKSEFDVGLLAHDDVQSAFMESIQDRFNRRCMNVEVNGRYSEMKEAILEAAEEHLKCGRKIQKSWLSDATLKIIEEKRMAFIRWQEDRTDPQRTETYKALRKQVRRAVTRDKEKWLDGIMNEMEEDMKRHRQGDFYKKMRRLNARQPSVTNILSENGELLQTNEEKMARWKRHFAGILNVEHAVSEDITNHLTDNSEGETSEITRDEVVKAIRRLKNGRSPGEDEVVAEMLKAGGEAIVEWLFDILREVWRTRRVPVEWKRAVLVPIHKKNDRKVCNNYRGIALLSIPGKVLSLILLERLQTIIDPQLLNSQCGFRKGRGTVDQIWVTRQLVERANEYHTPISLGFVDLTKAYDSVDRPTLGAILRHYGVTHQLADIITDLYTGTTCRVRASEGVSEEFEVKTGVRQGCVLSPMLFNCYMDHILREAMEMTEGGLQIEYSTSGGLFLTYRDKTPLTTSIRNIQYADDLTMAAQTKAELQEMFEVLEAACRKYGMKINEEKTKIMSIGDNQSDQHHIKLGSRVLEEVESFSYLGSEIGQSAKVGKEVNIRLKKASTVYQMWRRKVFKNRSLSKTTKLKVFRTCVMPVLLYGAETWTVTQDEMRKLKTFHMGCIRDILGFTLWDRRRNEDLLKEADEQPMEKRMKEMRLRWFGHLQRMPDHWPQKQLLKFRPKGKKRRPGGTQQRWVDLISRDLQGLDDWQSDCQDRKKWRQLIRTNRGSGAV